MTSNLTDPRPLFAQATRTLRPIAVAVGPHHLDLPTACDDYDVGAMIGHLLAVLGRVEKMGVGGDPMAVPTVVELDEAAIIEQVDSAIERSITSWADGAALERTIILPWVQSEGRQLLFTYVSELTVHTWDLAASIGATPAWDPEVVAAALEASRHALPDGDREAAFEQLRPHLPPGITRPFANPLTVGEDAPSIDRLVSWYGRRPSLVS